MFLQKRPIAFFDLECYRNYFLCKFLFNDTGDYASFVMVPGVALNRIGILLVLARYTIVGFNSLGYDCPILALALSGADNQQLKDANDTIIVKKVKHWEFYRMYNVQMPQCADHIDIMENLPGVRISLKTYAGIAHCETIQDLPIDPSADIGLMDRINLDTYCGNDLRVTRDLYNIAVKRGWVALRERISEDIKIDVRSKSDAQIAEAIFRSKLGYRPEPTKYPDKFQFTYQAPGTIKFQTQQLRDVLDVVLRSPFEVRDSDQATGEVDEYTGKPIKSGIKIHPDIIKQRVKIGDATYKFGAGGLHSQESAVWYETDDTHVVVDTDVKSYYPSMILQLGMCPQSIGEPFQIIYRATYEERITAKAQAGELKALLKKMAVDDPRRPEMELRFETLDTLASSGKIILNGVFGKLGSRYSMFFAPELLMQVTITGQLYLLMLIEALHLAGIQVVSANTDGIVTRCPRPMVALRDKIMRDWQMQTGMELEYTYYKGIYFRDVNSYIAITTDGDVKRKGCFTPAEVGSGPSGSKAPHREIVMDAVVAYVKDKTPIDETIYRCRDIRKFVSVRAVGKGKAMHRWQDAYSIDPAAFESAEQADAMGAECDIELGKSVRWAYRRNYDGALHNKLNGNQIADSAGAWPLMRMPDTFPDWVDHEHYVHHARELLTKMGLQ